MSGDMPLDPQLGAWLQAVAARWISVGVPRHKRRRMSDELVRDLFQALRGGATTAELVCNDPVDFADAVAYANEVALRPRSVTYGSLIATCLVGGSLGAVLAWNTVYPASEALTSWSLPVALMVHVVAAGVVLVCMLAAPWLRFRRDPTMGRTLTRMAPWIVIGGAISVGPTVAIAHAFDYTTEPTVLLLEVALVASCCAGGIATARRQATRTHIHHTA